MIGEGSCAAQILSVVRGNMRETLPARSLDIAC